MNHQQYREWLPLLTYNELTTEQESQLRQHLKECSACTDELKQIQKLHAVVGDQPVRTPSEAMLQAARQDLRAALRMERSRKTWTERLFEGTQTWVPYLKVTAGAMAMLIVGVLIGHYAFRSTEVLPQSPRAYRPDPLSPLAKGNVQITNIKFQDSDPSDGQIEFTLDAVQPMHVKGNVDDSRIQKVLTYAMVNEQNPGIRLRAASALGEPMKSADPIVKIALINTLKNDDNDGVRREALVALQKLPPDEQIKDAFLHVLVHDKVPGMRVAAIKSLDAEHLKDQDVLNVFRKNAQHDSNDFVRLRAQTALQEVSLKQ